MVVVDPLLLVLTAALDAKLLKHHHQAEYAQSCPQHPPFPMQAHQHIGQTKHTTALLHNICSELLLWNVHQVTACCSELSHYVQ